METKQVSIEVGRVIYTGLYGRGTGVIYEVIGTPAPQTVRQLGGIMSTGGRCEVNIAFEYGGRALRLPECILMGVQWKLLDQVKTGEEVAAILAKALSYEATEKAKKDEAAARFKAAQAVALEAGKKLGLIPVVEFQATGKRGSAAAYNLRAELKAAGIKSRVKQDGYSAIDVRDVATADLERAKQIGAKYKAGRFDGMTDCYDYDPCPWGSVFGDVQYVDVRGE